MGGVEEVQEALWRHLAALRAQEPLRPLTVLAPTQEDAGALKREAAKRGLGGVAALLPVDVADRRLREAGQRWQTPPPGADRAVLRAALGGLGEGHVMRSRALPGRGRALEALRDGVGRLAEWLPAGDPNHPVEESPLLAATLAWVEAWMERLDGPWLPAALRLRLAAERKEGWAPDAVWGIADLNTAQVALLEGCREGLAWFVPGTLRKADAHDDEEPDPHLWRLQGWLGGEVEEAGGGPAPVAWMGCADFLEALLEAGRLEGALAAPEGVAERASLALAVLAGEPAPRLGRRLGAAPAGRWARYALEGGEEMPRREALEAMAAGGLQVDGLEEATRRLGIQRWGEDVARLERAVAGGTPPRGFADAPGLVARLRELGRVEMGPEGEAHGPDPAGRAAVAAAKAADEEGLADALALDDAPREPAPRGRVARLRHVALAAGEPLVLLGMTNDRFPGRLERPAGQDHLLEAHLGMPTPQQRLAEEVWRAWCLACPRGGVATTVLWEGLDERGERRFPTGLFGAVGEGAGGRPGWPAAGPRRQAQRALASWEAGAGALPAGLWEAPAREGPTSLRVTQIRKGEPPCPFAHWASEEGRQSPLGDPSGRLEPEALDVGSLFHAAVEDLARRFLAEGIALPVEAAVAAALAQHRDWYPLGRREAAAKRLEDVARALRREAKRWFEEAVDSPDEVLLEWSPPGDPEAGVAPGSFCLPGLASPLLRGKIDRVEVRGGAWTMADYKTGAAPAKITAADQTQAALYPFARPDRPGEAAFLYRYPMEERAGREVALPSAPKPASAQGWERLAETLAAWEAEWLAGGRRPRPGQHCLWCVWEPACRKAHWDVGGAEE